MVGKHIQQKLAANLAVNVARDSRLVIKAKLFKSTIILVCAALVLASCTTYRVRLESRTEPRSGAVILPSPT